MQTLYHIPDSNVFHIHGSLRKLEGLKKATAECKKECLETYIPEVGKQEALEIWRLKVGPSFQNMYIRQELQFGAVINKEKELSKINKWYNSDKEYSDYVEPSIRVIEDFIEKSTKKLGGNYKKLTYFVWTHNDIDTVVVMGHTLGGVDYPYYKEIIVPFLRDRVWIFYAHKGNTSAIMEFIEKTNLKNYRIETW